MCGIAGLIGASYSVDRLEQISHRMQMAIDHRGPDDRGIYLAPDGNAALIHTRLSILDLSPAGHQPMVSPDRRYFISFNGEIYNFRQLRSDLEQRGDRFESQTDTEVILKLYQRYGAACVNHLRGMFAFAIWDTQTQTAFLARDPLGIKPLYYWRSGSMLLFASELKAILASGLPSIELSIEGLYGYLLTGSVPEPHTLIENVQTLPAGHSLIWQQGDLTQQQYWQIQFQSEDVDQIEAIDRVRSALIDSIDHHFVSDVPVGVFLSGGIDSSAVLALSRQIQTGTLRTYSIAFEEAEFNEGALAHQVAQHFATEHTECTITASTARSLLPKFLSAIDQPSIDGFNTFCVSHLAQSNGAKVVLSGLGGDELFNGYGSFQTIPKMMRWGASAQAFKPLNTLVGAGLEQLSRSNRVRRIGDFLQQPASAFNAYRSFRGIFTHAEASAIAAQYLPDRSRPLRLIDQSIPPQPSVLDAVSWLELSGYMRNQLLRDSDVMSMAWGLELRVPFVDSVLVDTIATIPSALRLMPGKQLLVQAVPEIPKWVWNRPKRGFAFPFQTWMQHEWRDYFETVHAPRGVALQTWYQRWSLVALQQWWQQIQSARSS